MKILYAASEAAPYAKSGGLADVAGALPKALVRDGIDCRVIMPLYGDLKFKDTLTYVTNFSVPVGWRSQYCGLFKAEHDGVTFYFIDNEYYFKRSGLYGFYDDGERFAFFSRAILETLFYTDFEPDIINCNDWQTALTPVYLNLYYRHLDKFNHIKTVFTIHNIAYQGKYGMDILEDTCGIGARDAHIVEYDGCANFMKGAIETADKVTTVSPTYAQEILDPWFSHGLDGLLRQKQYKLCGILNGIDVDVFNPATDPDIPQNYDANTVQQGKPVCKAALQDEFGLNKDGSPVMAMVTRLVGHKGVDLVRSIAEGLLQQGIELVILGSGEAQYENFFNELCARNPGRVGVYIGFNAKLAQRIYAGADIFLMPSRSEPCGLAQMVSCRYGTIPVVRETGGLRDSIHDSGDNVGYVFQNFNLFPHLTVLENLIEAPIAHKKLSKKEALERAYSLLDVVGLRDKADAWSRHLSGGQQQRIAIARALALRPRVMLFDEPTSALDPELVGEVLDVIKKLARSGTTLVVVTHEIGFAREVADQVVFMVDGKIVEQGSSEEVLNRPSHARTRQFLSKVL